MKYKGKKGQEYEFYDKRVIVAWDDKAWADEVFCREYIKLFHQKDKVSRDSGFRTQSSSVR